MPMVNGKRFAYTKKVKQQLRKLKRKKLKRRDNYGIYKK